MANSIYRHLLSLPVVTVSDVHQAEQAIDAWHRSSPFCVQVGDRSARPEWHFTARRCQILCDQSMRLLIHQPMLLEWFRLRFGRTSGSPASLNKDLSYQDIHNAPGHSRCRAEGLQIARTTIALITEWLLNGRYSQLTLGFTLYAFFNALSFPLST
ncbi:hypothetical protein BDW72DRAFT_188001 [Aspergillus terricola var. indicus]